MINSPKASCRAPALRAAAAWRYRPDGTARDALESNGPAFVARPVMDTLARGLTFMLGGLEGFASHAIDVRAEDLTAVTLTNALRAPGGEHRAVRR